MKNLFIKIWTVVSKFVLVAIGIEKYSKLQFAKHIEEKTKKYPHD